MYFGLDPDRVGVLDQGVPEHAGGYYSGEQASAAGLNKAFWAKLTSYDGLAYYAWTEMEFLSGGFAAVPGGAVGLLVPGSNPAREPNGAVLAVPSFVRLQRAYFDPAAGWVYLVCSSGSADAPLKVNHSTFFAQTVQSIPDGTATDFSHWFLGSQGDWS